MGKGSLYVSVLTQSDATVYIIAQLLGAWIGSLAAYACNAPALSAISNKMIAAGKFDEIFTNEGVSHPDPSSLTSARFHPCHLPSPKRPQTGYRVRKRAPLDDGHRTDGILRPGPLQW